MRRQRRFRGSCNVHHRRGRSLNGHSARDPRVGREHQSRAYALAWMLPSGYMQGRIDYLTRPRSVPVDDADDILHLDDFDTPGGQ